MPSADQESLGHGETQIADLVALLPDRPHQVGEHAIGAALACMDLLMGVVRQQQREHRRRKIERAQWRRDSLIGEIEVQPQPAVGARFDRPVDRQSLRAAVGMDAEGPDEARHDAERVRCGGLLRAMVGGS